MLGRCERCKYVALYCILPLDFQQNREAWINFSGSSFLLLMFCVVLFVSSFFLLFCLFVIRQKGRDFKKRLSSQLVISCQHRPALQYEKKNIPSGQTRALNDLRLGANYYDRFCHHGTLLNDYENIVG